MSRNVYAHEVNNYSITTIHSEIIDLDHNSIIYQGRTKERASIKLGKRRANLRFDEIEKLILRSFNKAILSERMKYG
jgi:hypothetical protein